VLEKGVHPERNLSLRVIAMPKDTNHQGAVFGGVILAYIDQAGYVEARRQGDHAYVTASIQRVDFKAPIFAGDIVTLYTHVERIGTTSVTINVDVEATRTASSTTVPVTSATITLVAIGPDNRPTPIRASSQRGLT